MKASNSKKILICALSAITVFTVVAAEKGTNSSTDQPGAGKQHVFVFGEVLRPNRYRWTNGITFLDALECAGGYGAFGGYNKIEIRRPGLSTQVVSYAEAIRTPAKNPKLRAGDRVVVPRSRVRAAITYAETKLNRQSHIPIGVARWISVEGAVKHPTKIPWTNGMRLSVAI